MQFTNLVVFGFRLSEIRGSKFRCLNVGKMNLGHLGNRNHEFMHCQMKNSQESWYESGHIANLASIIFDLVGGLAEIFVAFFIFCLECMQNVVSDGAISHENETQ